MINRTLIYAPLFATPYLLTSPPLPLFPLPSLLPAPPEAGVSGFTPGTFFGFIYCREFPPISLKHLFVVSHGLHHQKII